ncbi:MAG TPA: hypothetical protein VMZ74_10940 [Ramlibacter sp.]|nr:hypothetical protein [Ramlibacter sp.]
MTDSNLLVTLVLALAAYGAYELLRRASRLILDRRQASTSRERSHSMKPFTTIAVAVFSLIALLQLLRVVLGWDVVVGAMHIPLWASGVAFVVAGGLAVLLWRENRS